MGTIERFATDQIRPSERLEYWNRLTDETYPGTSVDERGDGFRAEMLRWRLGALTMIRPRANASVVTRKPGRDEPEGIVLHLLHRGHGSHQQRGRTAELSTGDFSLCSTASPYRLDLSSHEFLVVEIPRPALEPRIDGLDDLIARRISGAAAGSRLMHNFFLSLWQQGDQSNAEPDWQQGIADVLLDLIGLAVRGADVSLDGAHAQRERALRVIETCLGEPALGSATIAAELGVSVRTVQNIFAGMGTTPSGYILARRLARASEMLSVHPKMSITDVAFELGFSESGYFTRCFRQRFGTTPSRWRVQH
jgi:AraC-like DNA-binding protein